jgi:hypothetical protein
VLIAPALPLALIHPTAWKWNSANFAYTEFYEVRELGVLGSFASCEAPVLSVTLRSQFASVERHP